MNVLLQHPHRMDEISGVVTFVKNLEVFLEANGCATRVLASKSASRRNYSELIGWAHVVHLSSSDLRAFAAAKLRRKPVVLHYHFPFWGTWKTAADRKCGFWGCLWKSIAVFWSHGRGWRHTPKFWHYFLDQVSRIVARVVLAGVADARVAVSAFIKDDAKLPFSVLTLPNPLDFSRFMHLLGRPLPARPRFCFVGRVTPEKGPQRLIEAAAILIKEGQLLDLDIVGSGDYLQELEFLATRLGIESHVDFHGRLASQEVLAVMADSTAVVVPSEWDDPAPYTTTEAYAVGRALIASSRGGLPEYVGPGLLFVPGDVQGLANHLRHLCASPEDAAAIGRSGHEFAKNRCGTARCVLPLVELYHSLIVEPRSTLRWQTRA